jgi:hypothetical protein
MKAAQRVNRAYYSSWFFFLKQALRQGIRVNEAAYHEWGTIEELGTLSFNQWWDRRGEQVARNNASRNAKLVSVDSSKVTIEFPLSLNSRAVKASASAIFTKAKRAVSSSVTNGKDRRFNYKTFKILEKMLEIELDQPTRRTKRVIDKKHAGQLQQVTFAKKAVILSDLFTAQSQVNKKTLETYRRRAKECEQRGDRKRVQFYRERAASLSEFIARQDAQWTDAERDELATIDPSLARKLSRWSLQARILMLNAALGHFSGNDWYGKELGEKLREKERSLGVGVKLTKRSKGGKNELQKFRDKKIRGAKGQLWETDADYHRDYSPSPNTTYSE